VSILVPSPRLKNFFSQRFPRFLGHKESYFFDISFNPFHNFFMKHLKKLWKSLSFHVSRIQIRLLQLFNPDKALLIKREGERTLLIDQLTRSIEVNEGYRKIRAKHGGSFSKNSPIVELQKKFLNDIISCSIHDFETRATKWIKKMESLPKLAK